MTGESTKQMTITVIDEAGLAGARQHQTCTLLEVSCRTLRRWRLGRPTLARALPNNARRRL